MHNGSLLYFIIIMPNYPLTRGANQAIQNLPSIEIRNPHQINARVVVTHYRINQQDELVNVDIGGLDTIICNSLAGRVISNVFLPQQYNEGINNPNEVIIIRP
ncbi:MAG: hypothetical protein GKR88_02435 [Flavobacteriaceae bacterium]|nr:MAG: hypothetical protein GKR88_02435 [Flavobacteriaceae bacterium]